MPIRTGHVTAKSKYGIMLDGNDEWLNWSKPEYRDEPWEAESVVKGDVVELTVDGSGKFVITIERISAASDVTPDGLPLRQQGDTAKDPGPAVAQWSYREKDILMLQESCIKSAVAIYAACITAGLYKNVPEADVILAYSEALAKHAMEQL